MLPVEMRERNEKTESPQRNDLMTFEYALPMSSHTPARRNAHKLRLLHIVALQKHRLEVGLLDGPLRFTSLEDGRQETYFLESQQ